MTREIYGALARIFTFVVAIIGAIIIYAGMFAHGFVTDQLNQEKITMPEGQAITSLKSQEAQDALKPYEGKTMSTGPQAKAYADHFIWEHMMASSNGRTYGEMGDDIKQAKAEGKSAEDIKKLNDTRDSLFKGDSLRGILLNAYGWWLVGSIAIWAGVAMLVLAAVLAFLGFVTLKPKRA